MQLGQQLESTAATAGWPRKTWGLLRRHPFLSAVGVIVFTGLTAYDTQKIKAMAAAGAEGRKPAILGALTLYLDFINLFLMLLRFLGNRR